MGTNKLPSYPLRIEQELRDKLDTAAKENGRSMNAEISHRLEKSFGAEVSGAMDIDPLLLEMATLEVRLSCAELDIQPTPQVFAKAVRQTYFHLLDRRESHDEDADDDWQITFIKQRDRASRSS